MVKMVNGFLKKIFGSEPIYGQIGAKYFGEKDDVEKKDEKSEILRKDKYVFSSVFPNEEVMKKVDAIMAEGEQ